MIPMTQLYKCWLEALHAPDGKISLSDSLSSFYMFIMNDLSIIATISSVNRLRSVSIGMKDRRLDIHFDRSRSENPLHYPKEIFW